MQASHPPPSVAIRPPKNEALRLSIEQAARHCAANPSFFQALHAASISAGSLSSKASSAYNFMFDANAEGHNYFNWYLSSCRQNQVAPSCTSGSDSTGIHGGRPAPFAPAAPAALLHGSPPDMSFASDATSRFHSSHPMTSFAPPPPSIPYSSCSTPSACPIPLNAPPTPLSMPPHRSVGSLLMVPPAPTSSSDMNPPFHIYPSSNVVPQHREDTSYYQSPPPVMFTLSQLKSQNTDPKAALVFQRINDFIKSASVTLVGCMKLDAGLNAILPFYPPFIASNPDYHVTCSILRLCSEDIQSFVGRLSLALLGYILMTTGNVKMEWRVHLLPHFPWISRLTYLAAFSPQEKALVKAIIAKAYETSVLSHEQRVKFLSLVEARSIPNVSAVFNNPLISVNNSKYNESRSRFKTEPVFSSATPPRRSAFTKQDDQKPEEPKLQRTSSPPLSPLLPSSSPAPAPYSHTETSPVSESLDLNSCTAQQQDSAGLLSTTESFATADVISPHAATPDRISGGVLASFLKQVSKRSRHLQAAFVPYRPLDTFPIPPSVPSNGNVATEYLVERLAAMQEEIEAGFATLSCSISHSRSMSSKQITSRSNFDRSRSLESRRRDDDAPPSSIGRLPNKKKRVTREFRERGSGLTSYAEARWEKPMAWTQAEMGIAEDGSVLGETGADRLGLGANLKPSSTTSAADGLFDDYRKQRAQKYHKTIAQAQADRAHEESKDPSRLCFICQKAGHLARECKFGLT